jgi:hypothetical protein
VRTLPRAVWLLLALALVRGLLYASLTPPWQAPDEPGHFEHAHLLAYYGRLITLEDARPELEGALIRSLYQYRGWEYVRQTPPDPVPARLHELTGLNSRTLWRFSLAYVPYALAARPLLGQDVTLQLLAMRLVSVLLSPLVVLLTYLTARLVEPRSQVLALAAAIFVLFLPQHTYINAMVSDGNLAELFACGALYLLVKLQQAGITWPRMLGCGLCIALAVLTKATGYFLVPLVLIVGMSMLWRWLQSTGQQPAQTRLPAPALLAATVVGLLLLPALSLAVLPLVSSQPLAMLANIGSNQENLRDGWNYLLRLNQDREFEQALRSVFASFWGDFGWMIAGLPQVVYWALFVPPALALLGWGARWRRRQFSVERLSPYPLLGLAALLPWAFMVAWFVASPVGLHSNQGRYLFGGIIALALLLVRGWLHLAPASFAGRTLWAITLGMVALDMLALFGTLLQYFFPEAWPSVPGLLAGLTAHKPGLFGWAGWYVGLVAVYFGLLVWLAAVLGTATRRPIGALTE